MAVEQESLVRNEADILVSVDGEEAMKQPATFRCCSLGVQFYSPNEFDLYKVLDITFCLADQPDAPSEIACSGIVVHCQKETASDLFRVWIFFTDMPDSTRNHLHCIAKESNTLCPFCENY